MLLADAMITATTIEHCFPMLSGNENNKRRDTSDFWVLVNEEMFIFASC